MLYISDIQSGTEDNGCGLFEYRIFVEFHINLWECSMYNNCYAFLYSFSGLYYKIHIQSIYNVARRKLKPG